MYFQKKHDEFTYADQHIGFEYFGIVTRSFGGNTESDYFKNIILDIRSDFPSTNHDYRFLYFGSWSGNTYYYGLIYKLYDANNRYIVDFTFIQRYSTTFGYIKTGEYLDGALNYSSLKID